MGTCVSKSKAQPTDRPDLDRAHLQRIAKDVRLAPPVNMAENIRISSYHHRSIHEMPAEPMPLHVHEAGDQKANPISISIAVDDFETKFIPDARVLERKLKLSQANAVVQAQEIRRLRLVNSAAEAMRDEALKKAAFAQSEVNRKDKALKESRATVRKLKEKVGDLEEENAVMYEVLKRMKDASPAIEAGGVEEDWESCREDRSVVED